MSDILLKNVRVMDPGGPQHDAETDLLISDGVITRIAARQSKGNAEEVRMDGLCVSAGWMDLRPHFRDPGEEYKQGIRNGLDAAAAGADEAVSIPAGSTALAGCLRLPGDLGDRPGPAALLIAGSGPVDRDGNAKGAPIGIQAALAEARASGAPVFVDQTVEVEAHLLRLGVTRQFNWSR